MALWGGRFKQQPSDLFKKFNDSLPVDYRLASAGYSGLNLLVQGVGSGGRT